MSAGATKASYGKYGSKEKPIVYRLQYDESTGELAVSATPPRISIKKNEWVRIESNEPRAAIRFITPSLFYDPETNQGAPMPGEIFELGPEGRLCQVLHGLAYSKAECGYVEKDGEFETWSGDGIELPGGGG